MRLRLLATCVALIAIQPTLTSAVTIDMVTVGNPGNAPDTRYNSIAVGSVANAYQIGKYEVTAGQYTEFLNAVAASDPYQLYNTLMGSSTRGGITRSGASGSYVYSVKADAVAQGPGGTDYSYINKPVGFVSWYDSIRFANWLHNGTGSGDTENGAYTLLGGTPTPSNGNSITRNPGARWWLPSEDEWYKAAYFDPSGVYYDYPTATNSVPNNNLPSADTGNSANFYDNGYTTGNSSYPMTDAGAYALSDSPYGTFDQGGNAWEWNETLIGSSSRGLRGGSWFDNLNLSSVLHAAGRGDGVPTNQDSVVGFRVASIPEPSTLLLLCFGSLAVLWRRRGLVCASILAAVVSIATSAQAVTIDMVTVGNPGNAPDTRYESPGYGSVGNAYQIGKCEVTAGQYTDFLNAVADADPNGLYNTNMGSLSARGANIQRTGSSPTYSYSVAADWANRPVNYVSFWDAARFANWLHNGQPTGAQGPGTTEGGVYHDVGNQTLFGRNAGAKFFIPTEDEWYKAAYHKNDGVTGNYWDYPTASNTAPINTLPDPGNHANFYDAFGTGNNSFTIGSPYYRTEVGEFENSASPYGTFDQGGNLWEWNETAISSSRGLRGGSFGGSDILHASNRNYDAPTIEYSFRGFRVASNIPEPSTLLLLCFGSLAVLWRRRGLVCASILAAVVSIATSAQAVTIDMVTVGNPGNAPDTRYESPGYGSVGNAYQIGKCEVTAGQYTDFLNAVADADPNGLYNTNMGSLSARGANIQRTGSSPTYSYSVAADWANRPVNYVSFWDAARFANWLHNGQPTGAQGPGTTEGGVYHDVGNQTLFGRNAGAKFFIPTEDEWYKAAYHKNDGVTGNYWDYPTASNTAPINTLPDPGNHANFYDAFGTGNNSFTIGSPYYRTEVGEFENSASPYGTFDQGGNLWEWNETAISSSRGLRGGSFGGSDILHASNRNYDAPTIEYSFRGFRVASNIPEPSTLLLLCFGSLAVLWRRRGLACAAILAAATLGPHAQSARADSVVSVGVLRLPVPGGLDSGVTAVAVGYQYSLAVQNGGAFAWGRNNVGQLGDGTTTSRGTPVPVIGLASGVTAVAANPINSFSHSLAVQNGGLFAWGSNTFGQLGDGTTTARLMPVPVSGMDSGVTAIAAGYGHSLAVKDGGLYGWGFNVAGSLGDGTTTDRLIPVPVIGLSSGVTAIAASRWHSLAVKDGSVYAWGNNDAGQLGNGTFVGSSSTPALVSGLSSGATAVAASRDNSFAVVNGRVYAWGDGSNGGLGNGSPGISSIPVLVDPTNVTNIIAVAAGGPQFHQNFALSSDGSLWTWGGGGGGEVWALSRSTCCRRPATSSPRPPPAIDSPWPRWPPSPSQTRCCFSALEVWPRCGGDEA